ncbi:hypothetical protein ES332_D10G112600v1 [Gossypium tomentosum]|nr:hypothetical protein ES332_D10G112600v1 [Gossypium tomentosum]
MEKLKILTSLRPKVLLADNFHFYPPKNVLSFGSLPEISSSLPLFIFLWFFVPLPPGILSIERGQKAILSFDSYERSLIEEPDASHLVNGSWVLIACDSQARLFTLSLLNLLLGFEPQRMDSVKTALFKRHSNYNISVDEIGMKLDFVWAPYVLNLTHLLTDFKIKKKYPDVMVMGAGLWHMLHVSNPSDYELVLQTLKSSLVSLFPFSTDIANAYAEVVVMLVTTALVTLVMLLIWQTNLLMALCFPLLIGSIELIYFSAVLSKVMEGGWLPLVFATFFLTVMYIWHYGSVLKYQSEVREKISMDFMIELGSKLGTVRVPGIDLLYNELVHGIPSIFGQFLLSLPSIHSTIIFVCIKYVPVPVVPQEERFLFCRVGPKDYHIFKCIARYGYKDV